jgi:hypothetical protein
MGARDRLIALRDSNEIRQRPNPKLCLVFAIALLIAAVLSLLATVIPHHNGSEPVWETGVLALIWLAASAIAFWKVKRDRVREQTWMPPDR